jgi:long-chain fatty acid transport protein
VVFSANFSTNASRPSFTVGLNYDLGRGVSAGAFWQSEKDLTFDYVVRFASGPLAGVTQDLNLQHPQNVGFGVANRCLLDGKLLLAADALYKNWDNADFFRAIYDDQWAFHLGAQYAYSPRVKLRIGYGYNDDPTTGSVPGTIGGVVPVDGIPAVQYVEGQFAVITQHRLTGGIGIRDFVPNMDFDATLGGAFENNRTFGATAVELDTWFMAFGFTFRCPNNCRR